MNNDNDLARIQHVCRQARSVLADPMQDINATRSALAASLQILEQLGGVPYAGRSAKYAGSIQHTFEDEQYEPHGREVDVRVYYSWYDYDPVDGPSAAWGGMIEDVEMLAIRYFDKNGDEVPQDEHPLDIAWHLVNEHHEEVSEACTEDGYHNGAGSAPITYAPQRSSKQWAASVATDFAPRMAPSVASRADQQDRRHLG